MSAHKDDNLVAEIYTSMTGAGHGHDEQPVGPPPQPVLGVGHEPDDFFTRPIVNVPIFIGIVMVLSYAIATGLFAYYRDSNAKANRSANAEVAAKNNLPFDDRLARISSSDPKAEVNQPRLEWLRATDSERNGEKDPPWLRSVRSSEKGNSPEYRPEDLRPENYVDPITRQKVLRDYGWVNKQKNVGRIPIDVAMKLMLEKNAFPVQANVSAPVAGMATKPKLSNGGNDLPAKAAKVLTAAPKKDDHGHDHK
ncbi:MAG: hypothetical protein U0798_02710 [Gemmataceae bacterium]